MALLVDLVAVAVVLDIAGVVRARRLAVDPAVPLDPDEGRIGVLDIGMVAHRSSQM